MNYRRIASLEAYLIVSQDDKIVARHWRDPLGAWWHEDHMDDGSLRLTCLDTELQRGQLYRDVDFTTE